MLDRANEILLEHRRHPRHHGLLEGATVDVTDRTPVCGDEVRLMVRLEGDRAAEIHFVAQACSVATASASLLAEHLSGRTIPEIRERIAAVRALVAGQDRPELGDVTALAIVRQYPTRRACALLPWEMLDRALRGRDGV